MLAGACFALYHVGTYPPTDLVVLLISGIIYGGVFGITRNLIVLFPLTWAIGSTIGTIGGGFEFDWFTVAIYLGVLALQVALIAGISRRAEWRAQPNLGPATLP